MGTYIQSNIAFRQKRCEQRARFRDMQLFSLNDEARQPWVHRQLQHATAQIGNAPFLRDCSQFDQQCFRCFDSGRGRRIKPGKRGYILNACAVKQKRRFGQIRPFDLGRVVFGAG